MTAAEGFTPPADDKQLQRARLTVTLASITATAPLLVFNLALVERKWKVLLNRGPFLLEQPLQRWEKILFVCFFAAAILLLVVTASTALWWVIRRLMGLQAWWMAAAKKHTNRIFSHRWSGCSRRKGPRFSRTFHFRSTKARLNTRRGAVAVMEARVTDRRAR